LDCFIFYISLIYADCRGCCSRHDGVICKNGTTLCADGTPLSLVCKDKGCNACGSASIKNSIIINDEYQLSYNRKDWDNWIDDDGDCQDTRTEILIRDNKGDIKFKNNNACDVTEGKWICPYTGRIYYEASDVDIDHIVSLAYAYQNGGSQWTKEKRRQFANDLSNLIAVEDNINQSKGDKRPEEWMPPNKNYWPEYIKRWREIKRKYGLKINEVEERSLEIFEKPQKHNGFIFIEE